MSLFDTNAFNERLFFGRDDASPPPSGAIDDFVDVSGAALHVRTYAANAGARVLLLFHGNGEIVADYDQAAAQFAAAGFALVVTDYRGYGQSTGSPTLRQAIDDAHTVTTKVAAQAPGPIVVMGRSLGSACANELYGTNAPMIGGVVLESGFTDVAALVRRRGMQPPTQLTDADLVFDPLPKLARGTKPLLVLHGADDTLISAREAELAYATAGTAHKRLVLVPDRGHNDVSFARMYWDALATFAAEVTACAA